VDKMIGACGANVNAAVGSINYTRSMTVSDIDLQMRTKKVP
jgi:hypothetical protein